MLTAGFPTGICAALSGAAAGAPSVTIWEASGAAAMLTAGLPTGVWAALFGATAGPALGARVMYDGGSGAGACMALHGAGAGAFTGVDGKGSWGHIAWAAAPRVGGKGDGADTARPVKAVRALTGAMIGASSVEPGMKASGCGCGGKAAGAEPNASDCMSVPGAVAGLMAGLCPEAAMLGSMLGDGTAAGEERASDAKAAGGSAGRAMAGGTTACGPAAGALLCSAAGGDTVTLFTSGAGAFAKLGGRVPSSGPADGARIGKRPSGSGLATELGTRGADAGAAKFATILPGAVAGLLVGP